ncbi:hypothetical protein [Rhodopirellula sp. MGV]|uniref:hypothetical protein n=1 Tax=Rhodopirellula sp. MGV TaxID=2023130 RepID=UPI000B964CBA|nr:hypothetical protein [Rhodopirellula sp. MGV]OYP36826.1 hypothetical protein CGZ80_07200 [Rhodopirellula sp. MGV]PNY36467.1 hypothetical protein C2E31_12780 [Rhodopirellula baltica]
MSLPLVASLRFAGDYPIWLVVLFTLAAIVAVLALYQRETQQLPNPYRWLLPALRATAVAMVVLVIAGPVWHRRQVIGTLGRVIFAIDTSNSMSLKDSQGDSGQPTRLQRATNLLMGSTTELGWLEKIKQTHVVDVVAFDQGSVSPIWSSDDGGETPQSLDLSASGAATDLASPLNAVLASLNLNDGGSTDSSKAQQDSMRRSALVLMTDGQQTLANMGGRSSTALANHLKLGGTEVVTMGFGSTEEPPDVGIFEVRHPQTVAREGRLTGELVMKQSGERGTPIGIAIESEGEVVWKSDLLLDDQSVRNVPFDIDVQAIVERLKRKTPRGIERNNEVIQLTASVTSPGNNYATDNDRMDFRVTASTRDRHLLIVDGSSRWEERYLKNLFQRDPAWTANVVVFGPGTSEPSLPLGNREGQFPDSDTAFAEYDAVLLGEVEPSLLRTEDRGRLMRFVANGGGLILIEGRFGKLRTLASTEFGELMPVRYLGSQILNEPTGIRPTDLGMEQPALSLADGIENLQRFWMQLPPPMWSTNVELTKGSESWADAVIRNAQSTPWLATRMYGSGRVFYCGSDQTWRWRYKVADRFHARFWNQLVVAAMDPPYSASDQFVSLGTDRVEYSAGDPVEVRARLRDGRGNPVTDTTVDAMVMRDGIVIATVPLSVDQPERGTFKGLLQTLSPGEYTVRIRASGFDESALLATTPIWINQPRNAEMLRMSLNETTLREIASAGGGDYYHESDAQGILQHLKPLSSGTIIETDTVLWQSYFWFLPIIALLSVEWWCRKRAGLV